MSASPSCLCSAVWEEGWDNSVLLYGHSFLLSSLIHMHQDGLNTQETICGLWIRPLNMQEVASLSPSPLSPPWAWGLCTSHPSKRSCWPHCATSTGPVPATVAIMWVQTQGCQGRAGMPMCRAVVGSHLQRRKARQGLGTSSLAPGPFAQSRC